MNKKYSYSYGHDDIYCYKDSDVLKNKLDIRDADKLFEVERHIADVKGGMINCFFQKR